MTSDGSVEIETVLFSLPAIVASPAILAIIWKRSFLAQGVPRIDLSFYSLFEGAVTSIVSVLNSCWFIAKEVHNKWLFHEQYFCYSLDDDLINRPNVTFPFNPSKSIPCLFLLTCSFTVASLWFTPPQRLSALKWLPRILLLKDLANKVSAQLLPCQMLDFHTFHT